MDTSPCFDSAICQTPIRSILFLISSAHSLFHSIRSTYAFDPLQPMNPSTISNFNGDTYSLDKIKTSESDSSASKVAVSTSYE